MHKVHQEMQHKVQSHQEPKRKAQADHIPLHLTEEEFYGYHHVLDFDPHEGARHVSDLLGMHIKHPEELQRAEREAEVAHRYTHHPATRYDPDHFVSHEQHHRYSAHHEPLEGLPVHNKYGERVIEHDPYRQQYVHGTNYELVGAHSEPVIKHNPHAFPSKMDKVSHLTDAQHTSAPKEKKPAAKEAAATPQKKAPLKPKVPATTSKKP